jgi:putative DNA primase/helicase
MTDMTNAALRYIENGFPVIPLCHPKIDGECGCGRKHTGKQVGKAPLINDWVNKAAREPSEVLALWKKHPSANIGIHTKGYVVLDIDADSGGFNSKADIEAKYGKLPSTLTHRTGGGGEHWIYRNPNGAQVRNATKLGGYKGVDLRDDGGQIVAPPSLHKNGNSYEVMDDAEIAPVPQWLMEMASSKPDPAQEAEPDEAISEGERNATLASIAGSMRRRGMSQQAIEAALLVTNRQRCQPPLPDDEVLKIANSVSRYKPTAHAHRTDAGNASMLADINGDTLRYDHMRKRWLMWGRHKWETDRDGQIFRLALEVAKRRYDIARDIEDSKEKEAEAKFAIASEFRNRLEACAFLARSIKPVADKGDDWDKNTMLLGASNGVIDLRTGKLRPGVPEDRITMSVGLDFDPEAKCPRWKQFLKEIFDDADLIDWIWRVLGYTISGDTTEHIVLMGYGEGANGKSKFCNAISTALGDYAHTSPFSTFGLPASSSTNDLAALDLKRFVNSSETSNGTRLNIERIKAISGEDPISARYLYREFETYIPYLTLWLFANHKPHIKDDTIATWRRMRLIPFTKTFIKDAADNQLGKKLRAEAQGILAWMVQGCVEWQRRKIDAPECVRQATKEYRLETDPILGFKNARCIDSEGGKVKAGVLYEAYKTWADGSSQVLSQTAFGLGISKYYEKGNNSRGVYYKDVRLKGPIISIDLDAIS